MARRGQLGPERSVCVSAAVLDRRRVFVFLLMLVDLILTAVVTAHTIPHRGGVWKPKVVRHGARETLQRRYLSVFWR